MKTNEYLINAYENLWSPTITHNVKVQDWFSEIKSSQFSKQIEKVRQSSIESDYDKLKENLPCVTYNFLFDNYKKNDNIKFPTGLIYIDADDPLFQIEYLDTSKVYAYYHSVGGLGYAIIVRVKGLTLANFKCTYNHITADLNIPADDNARKATQSSVLSFDPNLFINENSYVYDMSCFASQSSVYALPSSSLAYTNEQGAKVTTKSKKNLKVRYDNLDEFVFDTDYVVDWEGISIVRCFIPWIKIKSGRNKFFLAYTANLVWLNPHIDETHTLRILLRVNQFHCKELFPESRLRKVIESIFKQKKEGKLQPSTSKRKIIFNKSALLTKEEKIGIVIQKLGERKINQSIQKISNIISGWDFETHGKITQRSIIKHNSIAKSTVEKYWDQFKAIISEKNTLFKESKAVSGKVCEMVKDQDILCSTENVA